MRTAEIHHRTGDYYGDSAEYLIWEIRDEQSVAAELYVSTDRHEIMNVEVREDLRGQGLARSLYQAATAQTTIYHAPVAHRTEEGHAFALAVGGETASYPCDCFGCEGD